MHKSQFTLPADIGTRFVRHRAPFHVLQHNVVCDEDRLSWNPKGSRLHVLINPLLTWCRMDESCGRNGSARIIRARKERSPKSLVSSLGVKGSIHAFKAYHIFCFNGTTRAIVSPKMRKGKNQKNGRISRDAPFLHSMCESKRVQESNFPKLLRFLHGDTYSRILNWPLFVGTHSV